MALSVPQFDTVKLFKRAMSDAMKRLGPHSTNIPHQPLHAHLIEAANFWVEIAARTNSQSWQVTLGHSEELAQFLCFAVTLQQEEGTLYSINYRFLDKLFACCISWLILHELQHIELGHFAFADSFGIAQRRKPKRQPIDAIPQQLHSRVLPSLELQADHDATELLLGAYSTVGWEELRQNVLAISAMMILIEIEEAKLDDDFQTHPKAATRIFQLLCHFAELPLIAAQLADDPSLLPDANEVESFGREVTLPCYFDAVEIATNAGAQSIQADLGNPIDFFKDMEFVKLGHPSRYSELTTQGAKEWAQLWECSELLKPLQTGVHFAK